MSSFKRGERIIAILLIAAILLSILSIVLTFTFDANNRYSSNTLNEENGLDSSGVGLTIQGTVANTNG